MNLLPKFYSDKNAAWVCWLWFTITFQWKSYQTDEPYYNFNLWTNN